MGPPKNYKNRNGTKAGHGNGFRYKAIFSVVLIVFLGIVASSYLIFNANLNYQSLLQSAFGANQRPSSQNCTEAMGQNYTEPQQYQYEGNPCHLFYINASISRINYTLNGGVDAPINVYNNMLIVPMNPPMTLVMMTNASMTNMSANVPLVSNLPFSLPSYYPPMNWSAVWGKLAAYNATTGSLIWEDNFSAPVMSQPLVVNNTIFISTGSDFVDILHVRNGIYAINATTGRILWSNLTIPEHMPTPVYYNNSIISLPGDGIGPTSHDMLAENPSTGAQLWTLNLSGESAMSSPTLVGNTIYFGLRLYPKQSGGNQSAGNQTVGNGLLTAAEFAVNLNSRQVLWKTVFNGSGLGTEDMPPAVWNNIVVAGFANSTAPQGMEPMNQGAENLNMTPQEAQDTVYLVGLNATTGKRIWTFSEGEGTNPPRSKIPAPTVYDGVVYSDGTVVGTLYALNVTTGQKLWSYHTGLSDPNPAVADGHVLDINQTGTLFVFDMNGTLANKMNLGLAMGWCGSGQLAIVGNDLAIGGENKQLLVLPLSGIING